MAAHLTEEELELFRRNKLSPAELLLAGDHIAGCEECRAAAARNAELAEAGASLYSVLTIEPVAFHLEYEQLEAYVDGRADVDDKTYTAAHLEMCASCRDDVEQLRQLGVEAEREFVPVEPNVSSGQRPRWIPAFRWVVLAAAVLIVAVISWIALRDRARVGLTDSAANLSGSPATPSATESGPAATPDVAAAATTPNSTDNDKPAIELRDGGQRVGLSRSGEVFGVGDLSRGQIQILERVLRSGDVRFADLRDLRSASGATMGDGSDTSNERFELRRPINQVVLTDKPTFTWDSLNGADTYVVDVYDTNFNKQATSGPIETNSWSTVLPRGKTYVWQVTATKAGSEIKAPSRPAREARFRIVGKDQGAAIERARAMHPRSHLLLGTLYAEAGMLNDALAEFEILARDNPGSELPKRLISSVRKELARTK